MGISALLASQILDASATGRSVITGADASAIRTTLGLGTLATQSPTGTPSASTFLRGDYSWQTIDLSGYVPYSGATGAVNLGANALTASRATLATGTITASTPAINVTQTWNNAATTFTGILANVTDTASNAASLLLDLQVGGTSKFKVDKIGAITIGGTTGRATFVLSDLGAGQYTNLFGDNTNYLVIRSAASTNSFYFNGSTSNGPGFTVASNLNIAWGSSTNAANTQDLILSRDAADTLAQRRSTNAQTFRVYNTYTDASNYERAKIAWESNVLRIGTEKAGTGSARALELQTDGTTRLTIASTGAVAATERITALDFLTTSDGRGFQVWQSAGGPAAVHFGMSVPGTSSGSDMWFSTTSNLNTWIGRLSISSSTGTATFYGNVQIADAKNIVINTTTGTKIGTATTQKLGFFDKTPVVQPTAVADATDAASVITQLNALLSRMRDLGLIAT